MSVLDVKFSLLLRLCMFRSDIVVNLVSVTLMYFGSPISSEWLACELRAGYFAMTNTTILEYEHRTSRRVMCWQWSSHLCRPRPVAIRELLQQSTFT